jgi:hypothetical protein
VAYTVVPTGASRPVPDQLRIEYQLLNNGVQVDTGSVIMTFPNEPTDTTPALRRARIRSLFVQAVRERIQAMKVADADFAAVQAAIASGTLTVTEAD